MPTEDVAYQQRLKIRRTTLGFGVIQVILGLVLTALSFTAFVLSESEKIRNACPYWAGFTVFCSGGVGIVAWRHSTVLSMGLFTFFSAVCVVLHMIGTILTGEVGGLLKSIILCQQNTISGSCMCCDSIMTCKQNVPSFKFEGVEECSILTGLLKELLYALCVLNIFGSLVCFIATILGCTSVARQAGRDQPLFRRRLSAPSDSHEQSQYSWLHYPTDLNMLPPYAPPVYRSVDNFQDCGATPYIVPPPVFDPTDLPPPYSSRNASLSSSGFSLYVQSEEHSGLGGSRVDHNSRGREGSSSIVVQEVLSSNSENRFQQRIYSENRGRPGNPARITSAVLTRNGVLEFRSNRSGNPRPVDRTANQSLNSSRASLQSEARRPMDIIGQRIEGIAQHFETHVLQRYEKAEECKELDESVEKLDSIEDQGITSLNNKWKYSCKQNTCEIQRHLTNVDQSAEIIRFEDRHDFNMKNSSHNANVNNNVIPKGKIDGGVVGGRQVNSSSIIEEEPISNSNSDSGLGDDLSPLCASTNLNSDYKDSDLVNITYIDSENGEFVDKEECPNRRDYMQDDERSRFVVSPSNPDIRIHGKENTKMQVFNTSAAISEETLISHGQRNSEQSVLGAAHDNECETSNGVLYSAVDNDFEKVCQNVFATSIVEPLIPLSGKDGEIVGQVHTLAKLCASYVPGSSGQDSEEFTPHEKCEKTERQELIPSEKVMPNGASHHQLMPNGASHHQLMPSGASHDQLMPSGASHQQMPSGASHDQLMPSGASHHQMPSGASHHQLMPSGASHHQLMPSGASHHQLLPNDSDYYLLLPSDINHQELMTNVSSHHQLVSGDAIHQEPSARPQDESVASSTNDQLLPNDVGHHQLILSNAAYYQSFLSSKNQNKLVPSDANHHWLIPLDAGHQGLLSNNAEQYKTLNATHHQLIPDSASSRKHLQPDYNTVTENCNTNQETSIAGLLLSIDDRSDLKYPCHGFPALVSQVSGRHSLKNAAGISWMDYSMMKNERSAKCHKDELPEPVLKVEGFQEKQSNNKEFTANESDEGLVKTVEDCVKKTGQETSALNTNNATLICPGKQEKCNSQDKGNHCESRNRKIDCTEEVIQLMDDCKLTDNVSQIHGDGLPVVQVNTNLGDWDQLSLYLEQQTASIICDTLQEESNNSQSSCNQPPGEIPCDSLATNCVEILSDSGSEHVEQISANSKTLARSDTCIAMETNYLTPREKIRTCSDPEVKGLGINRREFSNHKKGSRGRLLYDDCIGMAPPNIELPIEIRSQGLGYSPDECKFSDWNKGSVQQSGKSRTSRSANDLVKSKPKIQSCHHRNREFPQRNKDELLKKEKALIKSIKLRNEMSRSFLHPYREKKLCLRSKDPENLWSAGSEFSQDALKKGKLVQKVHGDLGNSRFVSSVEYLKKAGHHKHSTKEIGVGQSSSGKETFV